MRTITKTMTSLISTAALVLLAPAVANATIIWDWSFDNTSGQFITTGSDASVAGTYTLLDFSVTASDVATVGSLSLGDYAYGPFSTNDPFSMVWDGGQVIDWLHSGNNSFDWWAFDETSTGNDIFFGWETGNINTVDQAAYYMGDNSNPSYTVSVSAATSTTVAEPGILSLMGAGLIGLGLMRRRRMA